MKILITGDFCPQDRVAPTTSIARQNLRIQTPTHRRNDAFRQRMGRRYVKPNKQMEKL